MPIFSRILTAAALAALALPVAAQDTATTTQEQPAETQAEAPAEAPADTGDQAGSSETQLDFGQPAEGGDPQVGDRYAKEEHGDWTLACIKTEGETDPCSLVQIMTDDSDNPMAEFSLFRIKNGTQAVAGATIIVPLETLLPAGVTMSIDGAPAKRYNFTFCNPLGCVAQIGLTEADISAFKRGKAAKIAVKPAPAPDQTVEMDLSLSGFTAGYDVVDVVEN